MPAAMSYASALQSLRDGLKNAKEAVRKYTATVVTRQNKMFLAANRAAAEVTPMVQGFLLQNLHASGLHLGNSKDGSQSLASMVSSVEVVLIWKGNPQKPTGVTLKYQMPAGLAEKSYKKISSLNYGAVRTGAMARGLLGEKRKRTLKKQLWSGLGIILGTAPNTPGEKRKKTWLAKAGIDVTKASFKGASIKVGGFSATRAWKFFHLNHSQMGRVIAAFTIALERELSSIPD